MVFTGKTDPGGMNVKSWVTLLRFNGCESKRSDAGAILRPLKGFGDYTTWRLQGSVEGTVIQLRRVGLNSEALKSTRFL